MKANFLTIVILAFTLAISTGCGESKKWREQSDQWRQKFDDTNKQLQALQKQWDVFGKQMVVAADSIDPLLLKELFRRYSKVEETNAELTKLLQSRASGGVLFLDTEQLRLRFTRFKGDIIVSAWAGTAEEKGNRIAHVQLTSTDPSLPIEYNVAGLLFDESLAGLREMPAFAQDLRAKLAVQIFGQRRAEIDGRYRERVTTAFKTFLRTNAYETPEVDKREWNLRDILRRGGYHEIHISVEPVREDQPWELTATLTKVATTGEEQLKTFQFSPKMPEQARKHDFFTLWVKYPEGK